MTFSQGIVKELYYIGLKSCKEFCRLALLSEQYEYQSSCYLPAGYSSQAAGFVPALLSHVKAATCALFLRNTDSYAAG
jgi:hypothetical protein